MSAICADKRRGGCATGDSDCTAVYHARACILSCVMCLVRVQPQTPVRMYREVRSENLQTFRRQTAGFCLFVHGDYSNLP